MKEYYNGDILGYLLDGELHSDIPRGAAVTGHISTNDGVVIVLHHKKKILYVLLMCALIALVVAFWPHVEKVYFPVSFDSEPVRDGQTLYCNVVNTADITVTIQFIGFEFVSEKYTLNPGDSCPYVELAFNPSLIRYNDTYDFPLNVRDINE